MDDKSGLIVFLWSLSLTGKKNLPVLFVSFIITSGYCKTGSMNLVFYSLDTCLQWRWNNTFHIWKWIHVPYIYLYLEFNYFWTYHILSFCTCVICIWKIESSWTAVSFFLHRRECSQHTHFRIYFSLSYPQQYGLSLHYTGSYTFFKKEAIAHCVWHHCHFYPNGNYHCKYDQCINVQRLHKAPCRKNVLSWQIPQYFSM